MDGPFSESVFRRLPSAIRELDLYHQKVYIHLRLGERAEAIAHLLGIPMEDAERTIREVRESLIKTGQLDLIEPPALISRFGRKVRIVFGRFLDRSRPGVK